MISFQSKCFIVGPFTNQQLRSKNGIRPDLGGGIFNIYPGRHQRSDRPQGRRYFGKSTELSVSRTTYMQVVLALCRIQTAPPRTAAAAGDDQRLQGWQAARGMSWDCMSFKMS